MIHVLLLGRCRLGDITRSMCKVSLSRYDNAGEFNLAPVPSEAARPDADVLCEQLGRVCCEFEVDKRVEGCIFDIAIADKSASKAIVLRPLGEV